MYHISLTGSFSRVCTESKPPFQLGHDWPGGSRTVVGCAIFKIAIITVKFGASMFSNDAWLELDSNRAMVCCAHTRPV